MGPECQDDRVPGCQDAIVSGCQGVRESGCQGVRVSPAGAEGDRGGRGVGEGLLRLEPPR